MSSHFALMPTPSVSRTTICFLLTILTVPLRDRAHWMCLFFSIELSRGSISKFDLNWTAVGVHCDDTGCRSANQGTDFKYDTTLSLLGYFELQILLVIAVRRISF